MSSPYFVWEAPHNNMSQPRSPQERYESSQQARSQQLQERARSWQQQPPPQVVHPRSSPDIRRSHYSPKKNHRNDPLDHGDTRNRPPTKRMSNHPFDSEAPLPARQQHPKEAPVQHSNGGPMHPAPSFRSFSQQQRQQAPPQSAHAPSAYVQQFRQQQQQVPQQGAPQSAHAPSAYVQQFRQRQQPPNQFEVGGSNSNNHIQGSAYHQQHPQQQQQQQPQQYPRLSQHFERQSQAPQRQSEPYHSNHVSADQYAYHKNDPYKNVPLQMMEQPSIQEERQRQQQQMRRTPILFRDECEGSVMSGWSDKELLKKKTRRRNNSTTHANKNHPQPYQNSSHPHKSFPPQIRVLPTRESSSRGNHNNNKNDTTNPRRPKAVVLGGPFHYESVHNREGNMSDTETEMSRGRQAKPRPGSMAALAKHRLQKLVKAKSSSTNNNNTLHEHSEKKRHRPLIVSEATPHLAVSSSSSNSTTGSAPESSYLYETSSIPRNGGATLRAGVPDKSDQRPTPSSNPSHTRRIPKFSIKGAPRPSVSNSYAVEDREVVNDDQRYDSNARLHHWNEEEEEEKESVKQTDGLQPEEDYSTVGDGVSAYRYEAEDTFEDEDSDNNDINNNNEEEEKTHMMFSYSSTTQADESIPGDSAYHYEVDQYGEEDGEDEYSYCDAEQYKNTQNRNGPVEESAAATATTAAEWWNQPLESRSSEEQLPLQQQRVVMAEPQGPPSSVNRNNLGDPSQDESSDASLEHDRNRVASVPTLAYRRSSHAGPKYPPREKVSDVSPMKDDHTYKQMLGNGTDNNTEYDSTMNIGDDSPTSVIHYGRSEMDHEQIQLKRRPELDHYKLPTMPKTTGVQSEQQRAEDEVPLLSNSRKNHASEHRMHQSGRPLRSGYRRSPTGDCPSDEGDAFLYNDRTKDKQNKAEILSEPTQRTRRRRQDAHLSSHIQKARRTPPRASQEERRVHTSPNVAHRSDPGSKGQTLRNDAPSAVSHSDNSTNRPFDERSKISQQSDLRNKTNLAKPIPLTRTDSAVSLLFDERVADGKGRRVDSTAVDIQNTYSRNAPMTPPLRTWQEEEHATPKMAYASPLSDLGGTPPGLRSGPNEVSVDGFSVEFIEAVAAIVIQTMVRRRLASFKAYDRYNAVRTIQWNARIWLTKRRANSPKNFFSMEHEMYNLAAVQIQSRFRGWWARDCLGVDHYCATMIQSVVRCYLQKINYHYNIYRIVVCQSVIRRNRAILENESRLRLESILTIQSWFRGYTTRQWLHDVLSNGRDDMDERFVESAAAIVIQCTWRSYDAQMNYIHSLADILLVQSIVRRFIANRRVAPLLQSRRLEGAQCQVVHKYSPKRKVRETYVPQKEMDNASNNNMSDVLKAWKDRETKNNNVMRKDQEGGELPQSPTHPRRLRLSQTHTLNTP